MGERPGPDSLGRFFMYFAQVLRPFTRYNACMSSKVFVIADLHLGHRKVQELRGITDQDLVDAWNATVSKRDVVYVLGDVFKLDLLPKMAGHKKLALGNHDTKPMASYLEHFGTVRGCFEWDNCLLTHIPVHPCQQGRYRLNVHGHLHDHQIMGVPAFDGLARPHFFYRCVSVEQVGLAPVLLRKITGAGSSSRV